MIGASATRRTTRCPGCNGWHPQPPPWPVVRGRVVVTGICPGCVAIALDWQEELERTGAPVPPLVQRLHDKWVASPAADNTPARGGDPDGF